ncbi:MAG: AarF/UbiB family protein [Pseudobdellovibrio sp.]
MVRLLVLLTFLVATVSVHAEDLYLTNSQKAVLSLGLKAILLNKDDADYVVKNLVRELKFLKEKDRKSVEVRSYEHFLSFQKNENFFGQKKLEQLDIESIFEIIPDPYYYSNSERVQRKINNYYLQKFEFDKKIAKSALGLSADALNSNNQLSSESIRNFLKSKIDVYAESFMNKMNQAENSANQSVGAKKYVLILSKLLRSYFEALPLSQKAEIFYRLMQLPLQANSSDLFLTMIQHSGPQMQKLVQIIGRNPSIPKDFQVIFQKLESQVQPVPWNDVKKIISEEANLSEFSYFEHAALGVGTMAQTHRAQSVDADGKTRTSVVRFLKPGIEKLLEMDHKILTRIAIEIDADPSFAKFKLPSLKQLVEDIHNSVVEELNIEDTAANQRKGKEVYEKSAAISFYGQKNILEFHVPEVQIFGKNNKLMKQEIVFGKKPDSEVAKYSELYPDLYSVVAEKISELWLEQAFFGSGFFHADLHQGNLLMKVTDDKIQVNLLDFGMVGTLSKGQRKYAMLLSLGIKLNNSDLITDSYNHLTRYPMSAEKLSKFQDEVFARVQLINSGVETNVTAEQWTAWALTKGLDLQYEFIKLNRGMMAVAGLLHDSKSTMNFEDLALRVAMKNKVNVASVVLAQDFVSYTELMKFGVQTLRPKKQTTELQCKSLFL